MKTNLSKNIFYQRSAKLFLSKDHSILAFLPDNKSVFIIYCKRKLLFLELYVKDVKMKDQHESDENIFNYSNYLRKVLDNVNHLKEKKM